MDWGRAKTILIVSFLCLNILLGYQIWTSKINLDKANQGVTEGSETIYALLSSKDIRLETAIPESTPKLRDIVVRYDITANQAMVKELNPVVDSSVLDSKTGVRDSLGTQIPFVESYQVDSITSTSEYIMLYQMQDDHPMFEVQLKLYHRDGKLITYSQNHVVLQQGAEVEEQMVIPALTAVGRLVEVENLLAAGTVIRDVQLGYHGYGQNFTSETPVLAPTWRVVTDIGDSYYIHAISGAVEDPLKEKGN